MILKVNMNDKIVGQKSYYLFFERRWCNERKRVSAGSCEMAKRYGVIYVDGDNLGNGTYKRYKKDSFKWYHDYIQAQHQQFKK